MKEKIKNILEELDEIGGMSECEISEILKKDGINIVFYDYDDDRDESSTGVRWNKSIILEKDGLKYSAYINGNACAEFYYGRWIDTNCYATDSIEVNDYVE